MSFSDSDEDEALVMLEAARYTQKAEKLNDLRTPPTKRRRLMNNRQCAEQPPILHRKRNRLRRTINLRQRGSNIHITPLPLTQIKSANTNKSANMSSSSESDSESSEALFCAINPKKRPRETSHSHTLFLQNQRRRRELTQYDSSSSSSSSSSASAHPQTTNHNSLAGIHPVAPPVYHFGNKEYPTPLNINPGAIVRLELINFLCHANFAITFHPNINIVCGQNGSGKSAIEAAISMALGTSARRTMRGTTVRDVIKFNEDFAKIRLYLHNRGPEALAEFGSEICIERKLSTSGKNGTSSFKVLDSNLKTIGTGLRSVRDIADKLNIHVDNPCVVLKQETAKQFLNSSKDKEKYRFFMQASKLGDFVDVLRESMVNVQCALEQQRETKESFSAIQSKYSECKRNYDDLQSIETQETLVDFYIRSEKWMKYHKRVRNVNREQNVADKWKKKLLVGRSAFESQKVLLQTSVNRATELKKKIDDSEEEIDQYKAPMIAIKKELRSLEQRKKELVRKQNARNKLMARSRRKITGLQEEMLGLRHEIQNNERGKRLNDIDDKLSELKVELEKDKQQIAFLEANAIPTDEIKQKQNLLQRKQNDLDTKKYRVTQIECQLNTLRSQQTSTAELFCPYSAQRKRITIRQIRALIHENRHRFDRVPIGPIGEYISVKTHDVITGDAIDKKTQEKYIGVIQASLGDIITYFLVTSSSDQQLFRTICLQKFHIVIPCIQFAFDPHRYRLPSDAFKNYPSQRLEDGALLRINTLFDVKDNGIENDISGWVFNCIITWSNCERAYAYGTLNSAKAFLSGLNSSELRTLSCVYTYLEKKSIYKIARRGKSVSGTPMRSSAPIIGADTTRLVQHYTSILNMERNNCTMLRKEVDTLQDYVHNMEMTLNEYQSKVNDTQRNIHTLQSNIERLTSTKNDIDEDMETNEVHHERMLELEHSTQEEQAMIDHHLADIDPLCDEIVEIEQEQNGHRSKYEKLKERKQLKKSTIAGMKAQFEQFLETIKKNRIQIEEIPEKLKRLDAQLEEKLQFVDAQEEEINVLLEDAQESGDQVTPDQYPWKPPHLLNGNTHGARVKFTVHELVAYRKKMTASIEEWRKIHNNPRLIEGRYFNIKPRYEEHQKAVGKCNENVKRMKEILQERRREYKKMKTCVTDQLNTEFRYVMRQQAHDGNLEVDFANGLLSLKVIMASHDRSGQQKKQHHVVNSKTLSGGEKSFTQIALIMALQKFCGTPMCIYDEFDVFMDSVNRGNSIKILLKTAIKNGGDRQYIFITPHDVSPMMDRRYRDMIRIHKLEAPRS